MILFHKMLRDMRYAKAQFIAIFLMIFLGVFIFSGINADWNGMQKSADTYYEMTNMADVWVSGAAFHSDDAANLEQNQNVTDVERRMVVPVQMQGNDQSSLDLHVIEQGKLSQPYLIRGNAFESDVKGIWLDVNYAAENNIETGDTITLTYDDMLLEHVVQGLIMHPEYVYGTALGDMMPDHKNYGFALMHAQQFPDAHQLPYNQLVMKTTQPQLSEAFIKQTLHNNNVQVVQREQMSSYQVFADEISQHKAFASVFPIVFLLIALLTTLTTLSKLIMNQRTQIGILKALGFSKFRVIRHYTSHIACIASLGAFLGYVSGPLILPPMIYSMFRSMYVLPELKAHNILLSLILAVGSALLCYGIAYVIAYRQLKENAAQTLRPAGVHLTNTRVQGNGRIWRRLSFYGQWNLRDIARNSVRSSMAVIGVAGCMGLMLCALGLNDSMKQVIQTMYGDLQRYEMRANIAPETDVNQLKTRMQGSAIEEQSITIQVNGEEKTSILNVWEDTTHMKMQSVDGYREVDLPKEGLALSYNLAEEFNVGIGDSITWQLMGETTWTSMPVAQIIHTPAQQGITISRTVFEHQGYTFLSNAIVGNKVDVQDVEGVLNTQYIDELRTGMNGMLEGMYVMIFILIMGAVILGVVVLYNLQTFSYMEKERDMATLKVFGFKNQQIKKIMKQQNVWLTLSGMLLGIPFGYLLMHTVLATVSTTMDIQIYVHMTSVLLCLSGTFVLSIVIVRWVSRNIRHIDMVSALKAIE